MQSGDVCSTILNGCSRYAQFISTAWENILVDLLNRFVLQLHTADVGRAHRRLPNDRQFAG